MRRFLSLALACALAPAASHALRAQAPQLYDSTLFQTLEWRNIGPFRGGRVTAVTGVPSQPFTYYMGATGGGVWRTDDAGSNWRNVTDGFFKMGSVGAIAVADDDPNVVYVGMGEAPVRGVASSYGDGVYRSTDAGKTWTFVGLGLTRQISKIAIHPRNSDLVYVAAQGSRWAPTNDRGIYRSADGGKTWRKVLFVDANSGPSDLSMDPTNPRVLYAAFWDHQRTPWQMRSGGPGSGVWKTTDGGDTWTKLTAGLPTGTMGKIGVSVSPADPTRVYAVIEADSGGLYRSDDAGKTWRRTTDDRVIRARAWYYTAITADPQNADVVYVMNAPILKSIDGGRTFQVLPGPHGDNHQLWINPRNAAYMINGNDGGANISLNGGKTWSTQDNQPTAQFYRVNTDAAFAYYVYGGQQDNTPVAIASRTDNPGIDRTDWFTPAGCESARPAFDPRNPRLIYSGCYQGIIAEYDRDTRMARNIQPWPALGLGEPSNEQKYRFNWSPPIATSPHDRSVVYFGGNVLFRSSDRGMHWTVISPDLTRNEKSKQGLGGVPITNEGAGGEVYNTIYYVAESPHERGVIWAGTDDGLVQLTRDDGRTWTNVTPKAAGESLVNAIEISPHDPATAFVVITRYKCNDNTPYVFKTTDYGRSWTKIVNGFNPEHPVRVVREDPVRRGLLYAGTENAFYVSFDGGARWQHLQLNLPTVAVTDLQIHDTDLVASTEGRAFWILDDITPLRFVTDEVARSRAYLFKPRTAYLASFGSAAVPNTGKNPPDGAIIRYTLAQAPDSAGEVKLEIVDASARVVRTLTSQMRKPADAPGAETPVRLTAKKGMNTAVWDLRREPMTRVPGIFLQGSARGFRVGPGTYTVRLTALGQTVTRTLEVRGDPRAQLAEAEQARKQQLLQAIYNRVNEIHASVIRLRSVREQASALVARAGDGQVGAPLVQAAKGIAARVDSLESRLVQPRHKTFQDVINFRNGLSDQFLYLGDAVESSDSPVTQGAVERLDELNAQWAANRARVQQVLERDVPALNSMAASAGIVAIVVPAKP